MKHDVLPVTLIIISLLFSGCPKDADDSGPEDGINFRQEMRTFVQAISNDAHGFNASFIVIPQNGQELLTVDGEETGEPVLEYLSAIDGTGREDLFYGYDEDNVPTPVSQKDSMVAFLDIAETNGVEVLVIDYCWTQSYVDDSYANSEIKGYISFAAEHRDLDIIPSYPAIPYNVNNQDITNLSAADNFLYLINTHLFSSKNEFIDSLKQTNYDIIILDLFFDDIELTTADISSLRNKVDGGSRLLIAYMSIGEAEDYRYYWKAEWDTNPPDWMGDENPNWSGNFKVNYWNPEWQTIIYGNSNSYLKKILDAGFDGVYLDIIDAFEYFENQQ